MGLWKSMGKYVHIKQKVTKHAPLGRLLDAFVNILAGRHGLVEVTKRVKRGEALQRALARRDCANQSTTGDTLNTCTEVNVGDRCVRIWR